MKVLVVVGSALGDKSMGKAVFEKVVDLAQEKNESLECEFVVYNKVKKPALDKAVEGADFIVFTTSPFHCTLQSGFAQFLMDNFGNGELKNKPVAGFISSSGLFEKWCESQLCTLLTELGANYISGYSAIEYEFMENHEKPADIHIRTGNNLNDMAVWLFGCMTAVTAIATMKSDKKMAIVTSLKDGDPYNDKVIAQVKQVYPETEIFNLNDYKIADCTGCKYCYTNKKCCIKDDYKKLEDTLAEYDNIVQITELVNGIVSPVFMRYIQRDVHNGLYPFPAGASKKVLRFVKSNGYNTTLIKEYFTSLTSFGRQFSAVFFDNEVSKFRTVDNILRAQQTEQTMPNMDGYCKFYTRHFDNLSVMLQNLLKPEYEFFKDHPYAKPSNVNPQAREINSMEDARMSQMGRLMPVKEFNKNDKKRGNKKWKH